MTYILTFCMTLFSYTCPVNNTKVFAEEDTPYFWIEDVTDEIGKSGIQEWIVHEGETNHILIKDLRTNEVWVDGEEIPFTVEEIILPKATINYSSARNLSYYVAWRETLSFTVSVVLFCFSVYTQTDYNTLSDILSLYLDTKPALYATCTQYDSIESYYSSYEGVYYHKCINNNRRVRTYSSSGTTIWGPCAGAWFDSIRP